MTRSGILSCIKHFPGHGDVDTHIESFSLFCTKAELEQTYIFPFKRILGENHPFLSILLSHTSFPIVDDVPFSISKKGINELIRKELNFKSLLLSDDIGMGALKTKGNLDENAILAIEAGVDIVVSSKGKMSELVKAIVEKARIDAAFASRLDEAVWNILKMKETFFNKTNAQENKFDKKKFDQLKAKGDKIIFK